MMNVTDDHFYNQILSGSFCWRCSWQS